MENLILTVKFDGERYREKRITRLAIMCNWISEKYLNEIRQFMKSYKGQEIAEKHDYQRLQGKRHIGYICRQYKELYTKTGKKKWKKRLWQKLLFSVTRDIKMEKSVAQK